MNTLEMEFAIWLKGRGFVPDELLLADLRAAFNAGYLMGFDYAKKEAISTLARALSPRTTP